MQENDIITMNNAALALSIAFQRLSPYQLDSLNEALFSEFERFHLERYPKRSLTINSSEYQRICVLGMKKYHLQQLYMQKVSYDQFCETERIRALLPAELDSQELRRHMTGYKHMFDDEKRNDGQKKDPVAKGEQGLKISAGRKKRG